MCVATVFGLITSRSAISFCARPCARRLRTSRSRGVRPLVASAVRLAQLCRAGQRPPDTGDELVRHERLEDVVVGPDHEPGDGVERVRPGSRDEDDGKRLAEALSQRSTQLVPARHPAARRRAGPAPAPLHSSARALPRRSLASLDVVAGLDQQGRDELPVRGSVVDDEDRSVVLRHQRWLSVVRTRTCVHRSSLRR